TLLEQLGGVDLPMVGFGMGDVVLGELIETREGPPRAAPSADVFVVTVGEEDVFAALGLVHGLRERGVRVEYALRRMTVGKQLDLAVARGARHAIIIGPDERTAGDAVVRALGGHGKEERVNVSDLVTGYVFHG